MAIDPVTLGLLKFGSGAVGTVAAALKAREAARLRDAEDARVDSERRGAGAASDDDLEIDALRRRIGRGLATGRDETLRADLERGDQLSRIQKGFAFGRRRRELRDDLARGGGGDAAYIAALERLDRDEARDMEIEEARRELDRRGVLRGERDRGLSLLGEVGDDSFRQRALDASLVGGPRYGAADLAAGESAGYGDLGSEAIARLLRQFDVEDEEDVDADEYGAGGLRRVGDIVRRPRVGGGY